MFQWCVLIEESHFYKCGLSMELYDSACTCPSLWVAQGILAYHHLAWSCDYRWNEGAQLLPQPKLSLFVAAEDTGFGVSSSCLKCSLHKKGNHFLPTSPIYLAKRFREPILPLSLPFGLPDSFQLSSYVCLLWNLSQGERIVLLQHFIC